MDVFQYMRDADLKIERLLARMIACSFSMPADQRERESARILEAINLSWKYKQLLLTNLSSSEGLEPTLEESFLEQASIESIESEMKRNSGRKVVERDFRETLQALLEKIREYRKFCEEIFYPQVQARLSKSDLLRINLQLIQLL